MSQQFAQVDDFFRYGLPSTARGALTDDQIDAALVSFTQTMNACFRGRYGPNDGSGGDVLSRWGEEVVKYCCWGAAYELLSGTRGYNPAAGADPNILLRYQMTIDWLDKVQRRAVHPDVTAAVPQAGTYDQPIVISSSVVDQNGRRGSTRGW